MPQLEGSIMPEAKFMRNNYLLAISRYEFASRYAKDKIVLEAGCGAGYGADILAKVAKKVYGVDTSLGSIKDCHERFGHKKLEFKVQNIAKLDFSDNFFDLITCFEVIEHIIDYDLAISEFLRVLKPGGFLILSTPNKEVYSPGTKKPFYPFHFKEFTLTDLKKTLSRFGSLKIQGQFIKGKNLLLYRPLDPRRTIRIIFANLPFVVKKQIMNLYLVIFSWAYEHKIYKPPKVNKSDIYFSDDIAKTRIFICLAQKTK